MNRRKYAVLSCFMCACFLIFLPVASAQAVTRTAISVAQYPVGLAEDSQGNIYIADENNSRIQVVPAATGTLYGVSVTAGVEATILNNSSTYARGVAVDAQDNLFFATNDSKLKVITPTNRTIFGVAVTANTPTDVASSWSSGALDFDSNGNLFGVGIATNVLQVLPVSTGNIFGVSVTSNVRATIPTYVGGWFWDLAIDSANNVLIADGWGTKGIYLISSTTGTLYGQAVTQNVATKLTVFDLTSRRAGIDVDASGNVFSVIYGSYVQVYSPTGQDMFGQYINPNTLTRINDSSGYVNQGMMVTNSGDLITGGFTNTYRISNYLPAPPNKTVTFNSNGGSGSMANQTANAPTHLSSNNYAHTGYAFNGWNTLADGTGTAYQDLADYSFSSDQILYAQWVALPAAETAQLASTGYRLGELTVFAGVVLPLGVAIMVARRARASRKS